MSVANIVGREKTIVTCDQAITEIALGLKKKKSIKYESLILRMGGFHIASNLLFWFFGDFRCGALLFMVIHVIYKYKNR